MGAAGKFSLRKGFNVFHDVELSAFSSPPHVSFAELSRTHSTACQLPSPLAWNRFAALVLGPRGAGHITLLPRPLDASRSPAASVLILLVAAASSQVGSWRPPRKGQLGSSGRPLPPGASEEKALCPAHPRLSWIAAVEAQGTQGGPRLRLGRALAWVLGA